MNISSRPENESCVLLPTDHAGPQPVSPVSPRLAHLSSPDASPRESEENSCQRLKRRLQGFGPAGASPDPTALVNGLSGSESERAWGVLKNCSPSEPSALKTKLLTTCSY